MRITVLSSLIILILVGATGLSIWSYVSDSHLFGDKDMFNTKPLRIFTDQAAGTLTRPGIIEETNRHRADHNILALKENELLNQAATRKARDILEKQYFDHVSPEGKGPSDMVDTTNYMYLSVGENLALGNFQDDTDVVQAWMDSPGHRENILSSGFTEIGVAAVKGEFEGREAWVGVQVFALPESACPTPNANIRSQFDNEKTTLDNQQAELALIKSELDAKEETVTTMQREINDLTQRGRTLVEEGNANIRRGNEIHEETGDRQQAEPYWEKGASQQKEGHALIEQARAKQPEADTLRSALNAEQVKYNQDIETFQSRADELKELSNRLNDQITTYNNCLNEYN